ncbi:MAG: InlB B-repeat-containing protein [Kiritimatiellaeota bacterium]|nr:InlB B-repeat-containing protein [Kiritimatiellota bacterium]
MNTRNHGNSQSESNGGSRASEMNGNNGILITRNHNEATNRPQRRQGRFRHFATAALGIAILFGSVNANAQSNNWSSYATSLPPEVSNTYTITTEGQLAAFAAAVTNGNTFAGKTIELQNDLVMTNHFWTPAGDNNNPFMGTFDGNNKTITGILMDPESEFQYAGLFGYVKGNGVNQGIVRNMKLDKTAIIGSSGRSAYAGGIVGYNDFGTIEKCEILSGGVVANCITIGSFSTWDLFEYLTLGNISVSILANLNLSYAGGTVGFNDNGTIKDCKNSASVNALAYTTLACAGGMAGFNGNGGFVENCSNSGIVKAKSTDIMRDLEDDFIDAVIETYKNVGYMLANKAVTLMVKKVVNQCLGKAWDALTTFGVSFEKVENYSYAGGVVGKNIDGSIIDSTNSGKVKADATTSTCPQDIVGTLFDFAGLFVGSLNLHINIINVDSHAGGIAGWNTGGTIDNCKNSGEVDAHCWNMDYATLLGFAYTAIPSYTGGIAGYDAQGTIKNSSNSGALNADSENIIIFGASGGATSSHAGGMAGMKKGGAIENCSNSGKVNSYSLVVAGSFFASGAYARAGGVAGVLEGNGTISNCMSRGAVIAKWVNVSWLAWIWSNAEAGGVVGKNNSGTVANCYWRKNGSSGFKHDAVGANSGTKNKLYYFDTAPGKLSGMVNGKDSLQGALNDWVGAQEDYLCWNVMPAKENGYPYMPPPFSVGFDANGGTSGDASVTQGFGKSYKVPENPYWSEDWLFNGWYTSQEEGDSISPSTTVTTENTHTLYARWAYADDYDAILKNPNLSWRTSENSLWRGQEGAGYNGISSAVRSGAITHSQETWLETTVTGPGTLIFNWRVSSEANGDWLSCAVNGKLHDRISGESGWRWQGVKIPVGEHTIRWAYEKDFSINNGSDCGWLDEVAWIPQQDFEFFGSGRDGSPETPPQYSDLTKTTITGSNIQGAKSITVASTNGFNVGDEILIHISQDPSTTSNTAGTNQFNRITSISGNTLNLWEPLKYNFTVGSKKIQVLRVPNYSDLTVNGTLTCDAWDGSVGGITAFRARNLTVGTSGTITVSDKGYKGGDQRKAPGTSYAGLVERGHGMRGENVSNRPTDWAGSSTPSMNGGGAGRGQAGGGGGGNATAGKVGVEHTNSADVGGQGGAATSQQLVFGGGGGSGGVFYWWTWGSGWTHGGAGGRGGGCVFIGVRDMALNNGGSSVMAKGANGQAYPNDGGSNGGGGGAGGSVHLMSRSTLTDDRIDVTGGSGGVALGSSDNKNGGAGSTGQKSIERLPSAPTLTASKGTSTANVSLTWTPVTGASKYQVYRSTSNDGNGVTLLVTTSSLSGFIDTSAVADTTYYYWVRAVNSKNNGDYSAPETGWRARTSYTVTTASSPLAAGGATSGGGTKTTYSSCTVTAGVANVGYTFANWTEGATVVADTPAYTFSVLGDRTLTANWKPNGYRVTFNAMGGTVAPAYEIMTYHAPYGELPVPERRGYTFVGWYLGTTAITSNSIVATPSDHILQAKWTDRHGNSDADNGTGNGTNWEQNSDKDWGVNFSADDFEIRTPEELARFAFLVNQGNDFNGKTVKLMNDLVMTTYGIRTNDLDAVNAYTNSLTGIPYTTYAVAEHTNTYEVIEGTVTNDVDVITYTVTATNDLSMSAYYWTPAGTNLATRFNGTFDGQGYAIQGITINADGLLQYAGLFGYVHSEGMVCDVNLVDTDIAVSYAGDVFVGGVAGQNDGCILECSNNGTINAFSSSDIDSDYKVHVGGVAGVNRGDIMECASAGTVEAYASNASNVGGMAGWNIGQANIENCVNGSMVYASSSSKKSDAVGGMAGNNEGYVLYCVNNGTVHILSANFSYAGGMSGLNGNDGKIYNCQNNGAVSATVTNEIFNVIAGGITGDNLGYVRNCANRGEISTSISINSSAGGLVGYNFNGRVFNCINIGEVNSSHGNGMPGDTGGVVGYNYFGGEIKNCYWKRINDTDGFENFEIGGINDPNEELEIENLISFGATPMLTAIHPDYGTANLVTNLNKWVEDNDGEELSNVYYDYSDWTTNHSPDEYPILACFEHLYSTSMVIFDTQGGNVPAIHKTVTLDQPYGDLPEPERKGYAFEGWYTEPDGEGTRVDGNTVAESPADDRGALILYAHWTQTHTLTTPAFVPYTWLNQWENNIEDYEASAKVQGLNGYLVWESYVAGLTPTDANSRFRITNIVVNAESRISALDWNPRRSDRVYTVWGKTNLTDKAWHSPTNDATRFFKVTVELP